MRINILSAAVGAAAAVVIAGSTAAVAGTGIGGVFNLGKSNSVNATTGLTGSTANPQLAVTNTNTGSAASGVRITVPSGKPPIVASTGSGKATNLNADAVDGLSANQISRVAYGSNANTSWFEDGRTTVSTFTITAPQRGFLLLTGSVTPDYYSGCAYCFVHVRFTVDGTDQVAPAGAVNTSSEDAQTLATSVTVPVTKGVHTIALVGSWYDVNHTNVQPGNWANPSASALFVPANAVGGATALTTARVGTQPRRDATRRLESGTVR